VGARPHTHTHTHTHTPAELAFLHEDDVANTHTNTMANTHTHTHTHTHTQMHLQKVALFHKHDVANVRPLVVRGRDCIDDRDVERHQLASRCALCT